MDAAFFFLNSLLKCSVFGEACQGEVGASLFCFSQMIVSELTLPNSEASV